MVNFGLNGSRFLISITTGFRFPMLPVLHLRRRRHKPPRKHHRLGIRTVPHPLPRRHHHQVGHLPLQLRIPTSSPLPKKIRSQPQTRPAPHPLRQRLLGIRKSRRTLSRHPRQLRIPTRIQRSQVHPKPRCPTRLARRENETLQRQNPNRLQQLPHNRPDSRTSL